MTRFIKTGISFWLVGFALALVLIWGCGKDDDSTAEEYDLIVKVQGSQSRLMLEDPQTATQATTQESGQSAEEESEVEGGVTTAEIKKCSDYFGKPTEGFRIAGSHNDVTVTPEEVIAVKVTGNQNIFRAKIVGENAEGSEERPSFAGVCFVMGGNGASANLELTNIKTEKFYYYARGNSSSTAITVNEDAAIAAILIDLSGNSPALTIQGAGTYACPEQPAAKKGAVITCSK